MIWQRLVVQLIWQAALKCGVQKAMDLAAETNAYKITVRKIREFLTPKQDDTKKRPK